MSLSLLDSDTVELTCMRVLALQAVPGVTAVRPMAMGMRCHCWCGRCGAASSVLIRRAAAAAARAALAAGTASLGSRHGLLLQ